MLIISILLPLHHYITHRYKSGIYALSLYYTTALLTAIRKIFTYSLYAHSIAIASTLSPPHHCIAYCYKLGIYALSHNRTIALLTTVYQVFTCSLHTYSLPIVSILSLPHHCIAHRLVSQVFTHSVTTALLHC